MQLTGILGLIAAYAVLITAYTALAIGLVLIWNHLILEYLLTFLLKQFRVYKMFIETAYEILIRRYKKQNKPNE